MTDQQFNPVRRLLLKGAAATTIAGAARTQAQPVGVKPEANSGALQRLLMTA